MFLLKAEVMELAIELKNLAMAASASVSSPDVELSPDQKTPGHMLQNMCRLQGARFSVGPPDQVSLGLPEAVGLPDCL